MIPKVSTRCYRCLRCHEPCLQSSVLVCLTCGVLSKAAFASEVASFHDTGFQWELVRRQQGHARGEVWVRSRASRCPLCLPLLPLPRPSMSVFWKSARSVWMRHTMWISCRIPKPHGPIEANRGATSPAIAPAESVRRT